MTRARPLRIGALLAVALVAGCAYYNALYNARRLYDVAEAAADRGDASGAATAHRESLEKAARSLARDPDGRWADDALLLIGRNHFALRDCGPAAAALRAAMRESTDPDLIAQARAWLGAATYCLEQPAEAVAILDQAIAGLEPGSASSAFARLWRARARFDVGLADSAWNDLAHASDRDDALGRAASLEQIVRAIREDRPEFAIPAFHRLLADPAGDLHADSLRLLAGRVTERWGGAVAREALDPAPAAPWPGDIRDRIVIERARQAAAAGDTALALQELTTAASRSATGPANAARLAIARLHLAMANDATDLEEVRRTLLPAIADQTARRIIHGIGIVGALVEQAQQGQALALFAAAEVARDQLGADALARRLFIGYADIAGARPWSTKALLAALQLDPPPAEEAALRDRLTAANDVYSLAARGNAPEGFEDSETRLHQALSGLRSVAEERTRRRDLAVGEAIAQLDSVTAAARADSLGFACGAMADSLGLAGVRRDSVNAACVRDDVALVDSFLVVDTLALRDSAVAGQQRPARDTTATAEIE